jgi:glycosyltransferase involved in cell wall biosynthesis
MHSASMRVHLLIPAGDGGVFQHTIAVARYLQSSGVPVTVHMPDRHEPIELSDLETCKCVRWEFGTSNRVLRRGAVALSYLTKTQAHLLRASGPDDVVHVQGLFRMPLTAAAVVVQTLGGRRVVHSPHNTFSREGRADDARLLAFAERLAQATIVFNARDAEVVAEWGGRPFESPLPHVVQVSEERAEEWRRRWRSGGAERVVLFAGQIRADKRPDLLVRSAAGWPDGWRLAVVGEDKGAWAKTRRLADELGVVVDAEVGFVDLEAFTAALAAADVVACPYDQGSQSGVVSIANVVGTATLATSVGGLAEEADVAVEPGDVDGLTRGIEAAMAIDKRAGASDEEPTVRAHLAAYAVTRERRSIPHRLGAVLRALR